jgi:hypothetical protein
MNLFHFQITHVKFFTSRGLLFGWNDARARSCDALVVECISDASSPVPGYFSRDEGVVLTLCAVASQLP